MSSHEALTIEPEHDPFPLEMDLQLDPENPKTVLLKPLTLEQSYFIQHAVDELSAIKDRRLKSELSLKALAPRPHLGYAQISQLLLEVNPYDVYKLPTLSPEKVEKLRQEYPQRHYNHLSFKELSRLNEALKQLDDLDEGRVVSDPEDMTAMSVVRRAMIDQINNFGSDRQQAA